MLPNAGGDLHVDLPLPHQDLAYRLPLVDGEDLVHLVVSRHSIQHSDLVRRSRLIPEIRLASNGSIEDHLLRVLRRWEGGFARVGGEIVLRGWRWRGGRARSIQQLV